MRLRGELVAMREAPVDAAEMEALLFEIATPEQKRRRSLETLDLDFAYAYGDKARFRANYFYKTTGLAAVFRTIPTKVLTLEDLELPARRSASSPTGAPGWCSSPGRPARASRRRSRR